MFPEFVLDPPGPPEPGRKWTPEEEKHFQIMLSRRVSREEHLRLESMLLERMKQHKSELEEMLKVMNGHWTYEDHFYRYYHGSFKVYNTQQTTEQAVKLLRQLLPERELNLMFEDIIREGTGKEFAIEHNAEWEKHTRPMLEAFCHAKFMIEMAMRYSGLPSPPQPMPSGWAALVIHVRLAVKRGPWYAMEGLPRFRRIVLAVPAGFVLSAVGLILWWRLWLAHDIARDLKALSSRGVPVSSFELDRWYASVPPSENAALVMTQAFGLLHSFPDGRSNEVARFAFPSRRTALTSDQRRLLSEYVTMNLPAMQVAAGALQLTNARYPIDLSLGVYTPLPHLAALKKLAMAMESRAALEAESGQTEGVVLSILTLVAAARTLDREPCLISQFVRGAIIEQATRALQRTMNLCELDPRALNRLATGFAGAKNTDSARLGLIGERAIYIPYFRMSLAEALRITDSDEAGEKHPAEPPLKGPPPLLSRVTGFFERDLRFFLKTMEQGIAFASLPPPRSLAGDDLFENAGEQAQRRYYLLSAMVLPGLSRAEVREATFEAELRLAQLAIAIERFRSVKGRLPANLVEIVPEYLAQEPLDPFDGKPLRYTRLADGYCVYSVGRDRKDDGGREPPPRRKSSDTSTYDITFTVQR